MRPVKVPPFSFSEKKQVKNKKVIIFRPPPPFLSPPLLLLLASSNKKTPWMLPWTKSQPPSMPQTTRLKRPFVLHSAKRQETRSTLRASQLNLL